MALSDLDLGHARDYHASKRMSILNVVILFECAQLRCTCSKAILGPTEVTLQFPSIHELEVQTIELFGFGSLLLLAIRRLLDDLGLIRPKKKPRRRRRHGPKVPVNNST
jgi:hypothetical protein